MKNFVPHILLVFIVCLEVTAAQNGTCSNGTIFSDVFNNCLYAHPNDESFTDAENVCVGLNGHLVSIHNMFEHRTVWEYQQAAVGGRDFWIGLWRDVYVKPYTPWMWTDNSTYTWSKWDRGEPVGDITYVRANLWGTTDKIFNERRPFVCLLPMTPPY